uniref:FtsW/RodA/SpoVE family cell cycle protein n=2 Tax=Alloprevotella sp. TaxID=1872471 RepID=UPI003FEDA0BD
MSLSSKRLFQGDLVIWAIYFWLCMISLIEVYSAGSSLSYKSGDFMAPLFKQAIFLGIGTAVVWVIHSIPCRFFKLGVFLYPISIFLLILTLIIGAKENDGARWLNFGIKFQPSEIAKGALVLFVALILSFGQTEKGADKRAMKIILFATCLTCALIVTENLSTAALLFATVFVMMFIGRVPTKQLGKIVGVCLLGVVLLATIVTIFPKEKLNESKLLHRASTWVDRVKDHTSDKETMSDTIFLRDHAQEARAKIAIASSNMIGKMPGNSEQRDHLAQAYSDFIYAIIIEEMGVLGAVFVAFLYIILLFRAGRIASMCERNFPAYLTMGLAILLVIQAMVNMLVAVGLIPITGQPLPLISRGGTSTIINSVYFGMILSVSRYARKNLDGQKIEKLPASEDPQDKEFQSSEGME